jgi:uncharacterized protein (DUF983 family)
MENSKDGLEATFPIFSILGIVFIILKLCHVIDWGWMWVLAPFWAPFAVVFCIAIIFLFVAIIAKIFLYEKRK